MKKIREGKLINVDIDKLQELDNEVIKNAKTVNDIVLNIVNKATSDLDLLVYNIKETLRAYSYIDTEQLENYSLEISTLLYYLGQSQEYIGLRYDISKAVYKEKYAEIYETAIGTIADKTAYTENEVNYEFIEQSINERAYKRIKVKIENAVELLQSIKKILSRRIAEYELTKVSSADIKTIEQPIKRKSFNVVGRSKR